MDDKVYPRMVKAKRKIEWIGDWLWFLALGIASTIWCWTAARQLSATFDEPIYILRGLEHWRNGSHSGLIRLGTMPLPVDIQTLPLYLWERWRRVRFDPTGDLDRLLPWARAGTLVFWWLLLIYARLAARQLGGPWAGRLAVAMLACEPNLLAHASLATTDIAVTACLMALAYHFRIGRETCWMQRIGLPAFWFGASTLAKASGILFGLICLCVVEIDRRRKDEVSARPSSPHRPPKSGGRRGSPFEGSAVNRPAGRETPVVLTPRWISAWSGCVGIYLPRPLMFLLDPGFRRDLRQVVGFGLLLACLYCGCDWRPQPDFVAWARHLPPGPEARCMLWGAEHLRLFSNALEGIARQIGHNGSGQGWFLLGRSGKRAIWYYFPVALSIKLPLPLLILPLALAIVRMQALLNWACLTALALLALSLTFRVQIGIRYLLPLIAFGIVGLAAAVESRGKGKGERGKGIGNREVGTGYIDQCLGRQRVFTFPFPLFPFPFLIWMAVAAICVWPNGLCYTNELWGGTSRGYLRLSDSNYDWGQGLPELARWQRAHPERPLYVWYFGTDPAINRPPFHSLPLHLLPLAGPGALNSYLRGRYLAVSTSIVYSAYPLSSLNYVAYLRARHPFSRTSTFLIYDFSQ